MSYESASDAVSGGRTPENSTRRFKTNLWRYSYLVAHQMSELIWIPRYSPFLPILCVLPWFSVFWYRCRVCPAIKIPAPWQGLTPGIPRIVFQPAIWTRSMTPSHQKGCRRVHQRRYKNRLLYPVPCIPRWTTRCQRSQHRLWPRNLIVRNIRSRK